MAVKCFLSALLSAMLLVGLAAAARATPWAETGDRLLRSDLEVLHNYGLFAGPVTTWPMPWAQISAGLGTAAPEALPPHVRRSLARVQARLEDETETYRFQGELQSAVTSEPSLVRDFGRRARRELDVLGGVEFLWPSTAIRLNVGYQNDFDALDEDVGLDDEIVFDGSYVAQELGNWLFYGGAIEHWWGPGWISSLILSNNARPFPHVGIMRNNPKPFATPWLSWLGAWQVEAFVGVLPDERVVENPLLVGARLSISPLPDILPGLELGASRTLQICGEGRPCDLETWWKATVGDDNPGDEPGEDFLDPSNQEAAVDLRYTAQLGSMPISIYGQVIGEDEAISEEYRGAWLAGGSLAGGLGQNGAQWRLTAEYSDTTGRFGTQPDVLYEHHIHLPGYRYRGRALGASLDNDTRLFSLQASLTDIRDWTYRLTYHHADINHDGSVASPDPSHTVSRTAESINLVEAELSLPWRQSLFDIALRAQDDQPDTPGEREWQFAAEARWRLRF